MDTASTSDAVNFITYVQTLKRKIKQFEKNVDVSNRREQKHPFLTAADIKENFNQLFFP